MANLSIRKLDDLVYEKLRIKAKNHGISIEEEIRQILLLATSTPEQITAAFKKHFGRKQSVDLILPSKRTSHNPMDFEK